MSSFFNQRYLKCRPTSSHMSFAHKTISISPFTDSETMMDRTNRVKASPCPVCNRLVTTKLSNNSDGSLDIILECPDCGRSDIVLDRFEGDSAVFIVKGTGQEYHNDSRVTELQERYPENGTDVEKADHHSELAWEYYQIGRDDEVKEYWHKAVEEFRSAHDNDEGFKEVLLHHLIRMIRIRYQEVIDDCATAAGLLISAGSPSSPRECMIWLWYVQHQIDIDYDSDFDYYLGIRDRARAYLSSLQDSDLLEFPFLRTMDLLWDLETHGYLGGFEGFEYLTDEYSEEMYSRCVLGLHQTLESGLEPDPLLIDYYFKQSDEWISFTGDPSEGIDRFVSKCEQFGRYADMIKCRSMYYHVLNDLMDEVLPLTSWFSGFRSPVTKAHVDMMENMLILAESEADLRISGRILVEGYALFALMIGNLEFSQNAVQYAQMMKDQGFDSGGLLSYADMVDRKISMFFKNPRRSAPKKPSKKDRVKQKKMEHINKRK